MLCVCMSLHGKMLTNWWIEGRDFGDGARGRERQRDEIKKRIESIRGLPGGNGAWLCLLTYVVNRWFV